MNVIESYLEKGWGGSLDNPKPDDIKTVIEEIQRMDDEHGAFWVSVFDDDNNEVVLEANKNLQVTLILDPENLNPETFNDKTTCAKKWELVFDIFILLLAGDIDRIKKIIAS